ncbi:hypothetical protein EJB05_31660, partial [Eragrostis curvula]
MRRSPKLANSCTYSSPNGLLGTNQKSVGNGENNELKLAVFPSEGERYYLRLLLTHVRGATSWKSLRTVRGVTCETFREACDHAGLLLSDSYLDDTLTECAIWKMPSSFRQLFAIIMVFSEANNIRKLWEKHFDSLSEDFRRTISDPHELEQRTLNAEQRAGFDEIMDHVTSEKGRVFFIDGPGGTGKTYLYKALIATVRSMGFLAVATATSGIAASIMPGGRTAHSRFKIPIKISDESMCNFTKQSGTAELLRSARLLIWDEIAMTKRQSIECLDKSLQDIMGCDEPFGGKIMVFGGDFRQVLPVVPRGTRAQITNATLQRSYIWDRIRKIRLTQNMRAQSDPLFSQYLLRVGDGVEVSVGDDYIRLPEEIVIEYDEEKGIDKLVEDIFPNLLANVSDAAYMSSRAILSTKNEYVDQLNSKMIETFRGPSKVFYSFDYVEDDQINNYPIDFLNSLTPNGLPPHELKIKINCTLILLRNLDPHNGLCNGTRLVIRGFQNNAIDAEIVGGQHAGKRVFIPRIPLSPSEDLTLPFKFKRIQFPMRLSFAMTINKAQGQTIVGVSYGHAENTRPRETPGVMI